MAGLEIFPALFQTLLGIMRYQWCHTIIKSTFSKNMFKPLSLLVSAFVIFSVIAIVWLLWNGRIDIELGDLKIIGKGGKD